MENCDLDHDGFAGGPWEFVLSWNREYVKTPALLKEKGPFYRNATFLESSGLFAATVALPPEPGARMDYRLDLRPEAGSGAIDKGIPIPGLNDGFAGKGPDLGAFELGSPLPDYGPRAAER
jgi:hypothetical protein